MGLSSALATAMSGLRANQAALSIISSNVSNSQTPGYVAQSPNQIEVASGDFGSTVTTTGVNRALDLFVQNQLRTETGGGAYATQTANILTQLQSVYGTPGGEGTLETALNNFTTSLQSLSNSPGNFSAQGVALSSAQSLAQQLNTTTQGIQSLRSNVAQDIGNSAAQANVDMSQIAQLNSKLAGMSSTDPQAATLMDQRDNAINDLSKYVDVRVVTGSSNQTSIFTNSGIQLVGDGLASSFTYNSPGALSATSLYSTNPAQNGVGSLDIKLPNGASIDVVANNVLGSGQIAADLKLRDQTLVQAQTQVDQMAATLASSLSDITTAGTAVTGPPAGFSVDTSNVQPGNTVNLTYTDSTNTQRQISIVNVTDPAALPLQNGANANPLLVGVNFSSGMASVASQLNTALGSRGLQFSGSGSTLESAGIGGGDRQRRLDHDDSDVDPERKRATSALHRRQFALHRRVHRGRFADDRSCRTHRDQSGGVEQPDGAQQLQHLYRRRRQHALGFPVHPADRVDLQLFALDRARRRRPAVQRHDLGLSVSSSSASRAMPRRWRRNCSKARASSSRPCSRSSTPPPASTSTPRWRT